MTPPFDVLHEDNHLLVVHKPTGMLVQGDRTGDDNLLDLARQYIKHKYDKPGNVFMGLVHRLDRPVSGVVVLARTSKAASRLTRMFAQRKVTKVYYAVVMGTPPRERDTLSGNIARDEETSRLVLPSDPGGKPSRLSYRVVSRSSGLTLLEVTPDTGRHHQIRVQLAGEGCPVAGDLRYGANEPLQDRSIALHCAVLEFDHPVGGRSCRFTAPPPATGPWRHFEGALRGLG